MKTIILSCICLLIQSLVVGQNRPILDTVVDMSTFCNRSDDGEYLISDDCLPFKMTVPKGTQLLIGEWSAYIKLDDTFNIEVFEGDYKPKGDGTKLLSVRDGFGPFLPYNKQFLINKRKKSCEANDVNVLQEYIYEDENGFIAKTEIIVFERPEYHFFFAATNGKVGFTFENVKGRQYSELEARLMYRSLKSIVWN